MARRAFKTLQKARTLASKEQKPANPASQTGATTTHASFNGVSSLDDTAEAVMDTMSVDLMSLGPIERRALISGPIIDVQEASGTVIRSISTGLLNAASSNVSTLPRKDNTIMLAEDMGFAKEEVGLLLDWVNSTTTRNHPTPLMFNGNLAAAIRLDRAATFFGMEYYLKGVMARVSKGLRNKIPTADELRVIEDAATDKSDKFIAIVAGNIGYRIRRGILTETDEVVVTINKTMPLLASVVHQVNTPWRERQTAKNEKAARREEARARAKEGIARRKESARKQNESIMAKKANERLARIEEQNWYNRREELLTALNRGNKVVALTSEQLDLLHELKACGDPAVIRF